MPISRRATTPRVASISRTGTRHRLPLFLFSLSLAASALAQKSESQDSLLRRYPFDPACPWGRLGNGKGMVVRCLGEDEANQLLQRAVEGAAPAPAPVPTPPLSGAAGAGSAGAPNSAPSPDDKLEVTVGPITADQGELSLGKLSQPKTRYARCVLDHGGLRESTGEVHVRFLVRSKGIAEGVSVHKRSNVSAEAARCVAEIVDRRRVGAPDAPLVGATVVVKFDKVAK